jgi:hypothetical protein
MRRDSVMVKPTVGQPATTEHESERRWFVVGGEPGLALAFFFGDEFGSLAAFLVDAVASILLTSLFASRHHHSAR